VGLPFRCLALAAFMTCPPAAAAIAAGSAPTPRAQSTAVTATPPSLLGIWDVEQVAVDGQDQIHWEYGPDNPRYLYRALFIEGTTVRFNGSNLHCRQERWVPRSITWSRLLARGFPRPPVGGRPVRPTISDFDLAVSPTASVTAYPICPASTKEVFPAAAWVAVMTPDRIALRIDSSGLFILSRRPSGARPRASFPCAKALTVPEKTICADFDLAAWDRSVSVAWRQALERHASDDFVATQKEWLKKRDACGAAFSCLEAQMIERVGLLVQQANW
jgi:hypothetical protein